MKKMITPERSLSLIWTTTQSGLSFSLSMKITVKTLIPEIRKIKLSMSQKSDDERCLQKNLETKKNKISNPDSLGVNRSSICCEINHIL